MKDFESDSENEPPPLKCAKRDTNSTLEDENQIKKVILNGKVWQTKIGSLRLYHLVK